ncbi:MAG: AtpZ/AtpI family protein [Vampirovibrionales bacterium]|nr:AtpZ/AtpI family protein [Vampirovibrionales bacterium]
MEYALQLLIPVGLGLWLGMWLHDQFGASSLWSVVLAALGMAAGIGILYKRSAMLYPRRDPKTIIRRAQDDDDSDDDGSDDAESDNRNPGEKKHSEQRARDLWRDLYDENESPK